MSKTLKRKLKNDPNTNAERKKSKPESPYLTSVDRISSDSRLGETYFNKACLDLSRSLLNKYLIRRLENSQFLVGKIVETEAYLGGSDRASHTYNNKSTDRVKAMYMKAGTAYVYNIYGMYCCLNISSQEPGAAVLIRGLEPVHGIDQMRLKRKLDDVKATKLVANGPSKLCMALGITKRLFNQVDLFNQVVVLVSICA
jgi:DNA-3-methyladenine glycosylase